MASCITGVALLRRKPKPGKKVEFLRYFGQSSIAYLALEPMIWVFRETPLVWV